MKVEEYLKKFKEYDENTQAISKEIDALYNQIEDIEREAEKKIEKFRKQISKKSETVDKDKKEVADLLKKVFSDPNIYIKTDRLSFKPDARKVDFYYNNYYSAILPTSPTKEETKPIYKYLEERAIDCEEKDSKELLKEINNEVNNKGEYVLICKLSKDKNWSSSLEYGKFSRFEREIHCIETKTYGWYDNSVFTYYIKYFDSYKSLKEFLIKNILDAGIKSAYGHDEWDSSYNCTYIQDDINLRAYNFNFNNWAYNCEELLKQLTEIN